MTDARYHLSTDGTFTIANYHRAAPFSSFLPGIAGLWGIPLWLYYVNRGQGVACFGAENKDGAMMQFQSIYRHCSRIAQEGFRTFLKVNRNHDAAFYEPFRADSLDGIGNTLEIRPASLRLHEDNAPLGLSVTVDYFTVPNEPFAALARTVTITNTGEGPINIEALDGFPNVVPHGVTAHVLNLMPFILEGYLRIRNLDARTPFYQLRAGSSDAHDIATFTEGNFFFAFEQDAGPGELLQPIVDPRLIFGDRQDMSVPREFLARDAFEVPADQLLTCTTPCAFAHWPISLAPGESRAMHSLQGFVRSLERLNALPELVTGADYIRAKSNEAAIEIEKVRHRLFIHSNEAALNQYIPQTFLDNSLRGGVPLTLEAGDRKHVLHVYSRLHGDLERDYNNFCLEPTCFSQGNGNFRDANQNRRNDVWINPDVDIENLRYFFNLIQADGYNPLMCLGLRFTVADGDGLTGVLEECVPAESAATVRDHLASPFTPGTLFETIESNGIDLLVGREELLSRLLAVCERSENSEHGRGYWVDHWFYNFDLLESFLAIYPDRLREVLVDRHDFTYWDDAYPVPPRSETYTLRPDGEVRQYSEPRLDREKAELIASRENDRNLARLGAGHGEVHRTNLLEKAVCLFVNKAASLAPSGLGFDMDAGRPGWHDSINGLPSLFGSSMSECFQLRRVLALVADLIAEAGLPEDFSQDAPAEIVDYLERIIQLLEAFPLSGSSDPDFEYWQGAADARESFRDATRFGFSGKMQPLALSRITVFLEAAGKRVAASIEKAHDAESGLPLTYFAHRPVDYEKNERSSYVIVKRFESRRLPLFLEAPMHALRTERDTAAARKIYDALRAGPLYDEKLKMWLAGDDVSAEGPEIGRIGAWAPGWFENENVFMHMQHKLLLALLQAGLHDEFFENMLNCMCPFQDPRRYGRSPLENSSFIVSSRNPDVSRHGRGCQPRSSGTTAEVVHMTLVMSFGRKPFRRDGNGLSLCFEPILPDWLFTEAAQDRNVVDIDGTVHNMEFPADSYSALFLGHAMVTYLNPLRRATFGGDAVRVAGYRLTWNDGRSETIKGTALGDAHARAVRDRRIARIEVTLGA